MADVFEYDVFLSFASADELLARPVWEHLCATGLRVFWSDATLKDRLGEPWFEVVQHSLENSRHCVVVCTPAAMASEWVKREYASFLNRCYRRGERRLIPLLAGDLAPAQLPLFLGELGASRLDGPDSLRAMAVLLGGTDVESLRADLAVREEENHALRTAVERLTVAVERTQNAAPPSIARDGAPAAPRTVEASEGWGASSARKGAMSNGATAEAGASTRCKEAVRFWIGEIRASKGPFTAGELGEIITDENSREIFQVLQWALPAECKDGVISELRALLHAPDAMTQWKALRLLTYYGFDDAAAIREFWKGEPNGASRELVIDALEHLSSHEGLELAADIARYDTVPQLRRAAVNRLASYEVGWNRDDVVKPLMEALADRDGAVREVALRALQQLGALEAIESASRVAVKDDDPRVRVAAFKLLAALASVDSFMLAVRAYAVDRLGFLDFRDCVFLYEPRFGGPPLVQLAAGINTRSGHSVASYVQQCVEDAAVHRLPRQ